MKDPQRGLRPDRAGLEASDAPLCPSRAGSQSTPPRSGDHARAPGAVSANDSRDDRAASGAAIWARPSRTVSSPPK